MKKLLAALALSFLASSAIAETSPFVRLGATISISASVTSANAALSPTSAETIWVCNSGSYMAYVGFGDSTFVATSNDTPIPAGLCGNLSPHGKTYMAALASSNTTTITGTPGSGSLVGAGGGGSSGGGGGVITGPLGPATDAASVAVTTGGTDTSGEAIQGTGLKGYLATLAKWLDTLNTTSANPIVMPKYLYNSVAASATNYVLSATQGGATGAVGDYLSFCMVQPGTTSPGSITILDNATSVFAFPGGASSVSNLVPFAIPIGAVSSSGGWKITTTTNITAECFGKFS